MVCFATLNPILSINHAALNVNIVLNTQKVDLADFGSKADEISNALGKIMARLSTEICREQPISEEEIPKMRAAVGKRLPNLRYQFERTSGFSELADFCTNWIIEMEEVREALLPLALSLFRGLSYQPTKLQVTGGFLGSIANPIEGGEGMKF